MKSHFILLNIILAVFIAACVNNSDDTDNADDSYNHTLAPGRSAADLLNGDEYRALIVEIDYMGRQNRPDERALDSLQAFLERHLNKTEITIIDPVEVPSGSRNTFSATDIRNLEETYRTHYTKFDVLTVYMLIVNGRYERNNVLGIAYQNTSTAFFGLAFEDATAGFSAPSRYLTEAIAFRHEFGHLMGLVGIPGSGTITRSDHKDEEHGNHCTDNSCLMYYAMESPDLFDLFLGNEEIPQLDEFCLQDLKGNGGK